MLPELTAREHSRRSSTSLRRSAVVATLARMANEAMRDNWTTGAEGWVRNERIFDAALSPFTAAILGAADLGSATRVLDVGCGAGTLIEAAVAAGADAVGVDISSVDGRGGAPAGARPRRSSRPTLRPPTCSRPRRARRSTGWCRASG